MLHMVSPMVPLGGCTPALCTVSWRRVGAGIHIPCSETKLVQPKFRLGLVSS